MRLLVSEEVNLVAKDPPASAALEVSSLVNLFVLAQTLRPICFEVTFVTGMDFGWDSLTLFGVIREIVFQDELVTTITFNDCMDMLVNFQLIFRLTDKVTPWAGQIIPHIIIHAGVCVSVTILIRREWRNG